MFGSFIVFFHSLFTWCAYPAALVLLLVYLSKWETDKSLKANVVVRSVLLGVALSLLTLLFASFTTNPYSGNMSYHGFPAIVSAQDRPSKFWKVIPRWPRRWEPLPRARLVPVKYGSGSLIGLLSNIIIWSALAHRFYIQPRMLAKGAPDSAA